MEDGEITEAVETGEVMEEVETEEEDEEEEVRGFFLEVPILNYVAKLFSWQSLECEIS